jgi:hypothetical protein
LYFNSGFFLPPWLVDIVLCYGRIRHGSVGIFRKQLPNVRVVILLAESRVPKQDGFSMATNLTFKTVAPVLLLVLPSNYNWDRQANLLLT